MKTLMLDPKLVEAVARNFAIKPAEVTAKTGADNVPDWDSVGHLKLILDIEETFSVRFPARDIPTLTSAGRLQEALARLQTRG
jgi:acyl carrier protein